MKLPYGEIFDKLNESLKICFNKSYVEVFDNKKKTPEYVFPRHLTIKVMRDYGFTLEQVGRFTNRTHSAVLNGQRNINNILELMKPRRDVEKILEFMDLVNQNTTVTKILYEISLLDTNSKNELFNKLKK